MIRLLHGDCRTVMADMPEASVDAIVTDPPYELTAGKNGGTGTASVNLDSPYGRARIGTGNGAGGFMGQAWDATGVAHDVKMWREALRVLKPGGHLLAFGGTRTYHRMVCAIEDAGFEIRDQIGWLYGSGFPKSLDVSKAIDKAAGAVREVVGQRTDGRYAYGFSEQAKKALGGVVASESETGFSGEMGQITAPATDAARQWAGWGTALKPGWETAVVAVKPHDLRGICCILAQRILESVCRLPSLAKDAEPSSSLSQSASAEGFGSAQWLAVSECSTPADLFDLMATWPSRSALPSSLSTASSWLGILAEVLMHESTFTTETVSSLTTDLRTLNCSQSKITPLCIAEASIRASGTGSSAFLVAHIFSAVASRLEITRTLSALAPATSQDEAEGLRPSLEPIVLARKPLAGGTVAANVLAHGTGALNIDGCRVGDTVETWPASRSFRAGISSGYTEGIEKGATQATGAAPTGRWPANIIHDGSDEALAAFPQTTTNGQAQPFRQGGKPGDLFAFGADKLKAPRPTDTGSAARFFKECKWDSEKTDPPAIDASINSARKAAAAADIDRGQGTRFWYSAKANQHDRNDGTYDLPQRLEKSYEGGRIVSADHPETAKGGASVRGNHHPTIKPTDLMRYLCRLVTPPGGTVLDPFAGSGSTLKAAELEGFSAIGIELDLQYMEIARRRIASDTPLFAALAFGEG